MNTSTTKIPVLNSLQEVRPQEIITRSLRHFNILLTEGETVYLENVNENRSVQATVKEIGSYTEKTVFVIS